MQCAEQSCLPVSRPMTSPMHILNAANDRTSMPNMVLAHPANHAYDNEDEEIGREYEV